MTSRPVTFTANSQVTGAPAQNFRTDIQGLRALAVGAVVLYHAGLPFIPGGYVGVDVFFVISGFLITSHLLKSLTTTGRLGFADFYARRARRILPASFVVLLLSVLAALIWYPPLLMREVWAGAVATALYVPNYFFAVEGTNYLAESTPSLFQHYWSLGVEEQFYLVWPALLVLGFFLVKSRKALFALVALLVLLSFVACVLLTVRNQPWAFFSLPTRAWELGVGGLAAFALSHRATLLTPTQATIAGWLGVGGILGSALFFTAQTPFPSYWAAIPVLSTALVIVAGATTTTRGPAAVLSLRGMVFVGTISYSLYLVHWPMQVIPQTAIGYDNPLPMWVRLLIALAGVPLAWLMYRYVEDPARTAPILTRARPRRSLLAAAAASTLLVLFATAVLAYSTARPLSDGRIAGDTVVSAPPLATSFVPSNMSPSLDAVSTDQPIIYDQDCHRDFGSVDTSGCLYGSESLPRIALFGDSHAAQWFPALYAYAQDHGFAVETFTKSSCPSVDVDVARNGVPYGECMKWRAGVIKRLNEDEPELVVIANFGNASLIDDEGDYGRAWEVGLERTLTEIRAPRVVLADTPNMHQTPSICLSAHLSDSMACAEPSADALSGPARSAEARATDAARVKLIDMTPYLCGEDWCPPIIGSTLVYRDAHHMTATFSTLLAGRLGSQIGPLL